MRPRPSRLAAVSSQSVLVVQALIAALAALIFAMAVQLWLMSGKDWEACPKPVCYWVLFLTIARCQSFVLRLRCRKPVRTDQSQPRLPVLIDNAGRARGRHSKTGSTWEPPCPDSAARGGFNGGGDRGGEDIRTFFVLEGDFAGRSVPLSLFAHIKV